MERATVRLLSLDENETLRASNLRKGGWEFERLFIYLFIYLGTYA